MSCLNREAIEQLERMDLIGDCWSVITDLMIPEKDLHLVDREKLAALLGFLHREYEEARRGFTQALKAQ